MGFLNVMLLAGAAAFLVPLVIHLLNKRRVQIVRWGPMHLLHEALRQSRRNLKIEQLLLLLLRISIPIILALCLARPVLSALSHMPGMTKTSLVVLLDNSFSMRAPGAGGTVRDHAHEDLRRVLENLPRGSDASVILMGSPPRLLMDQPTTALDLIMQKLQTEPSLAGPLALHDALQIANAEIKRTGNASREVLVMSDFQQSDWRSLADGGTIAGLETLKQTQPAPQLTFFREEGDLQENLSLASLEPSAFVVAKDQTISLRTRIENHGKRAYQDLAVYLEADGARVRTTRVSVAPNAETVLNLTHSFDTAGEHSLTVRLEGDAFPDDNARSVVIPVREQVNCLLIGGAGTSAPLEGSTDFLQIALTPHRSAAATLKDVIQTNVVSWNEFRGHVGGNAGQSPEARTKGTEGNEVIIMSDVQKLQQKHVTDLEEFVKNGGSVIIFPGPDCDEAWYNKELYHDGKGLMPCQFKGAEHVTEGQAPARIISQRYTHPATSYFNDAPGLHLQAAAFQHWMRFDKIEGDSRVLLSLDRGDPLIVEKSLGKGRVILVASTANTRWNNLPLQPVFVPLMQRLVTYLASQSAAPQAQMCGTTLHVNIAKDHNQDVFTLTDPLNQAHELKPLTDKDGAASVEFADTQQPGIYELRSNFAPKTDPPRRFAFYLNAAESDFSTTPSAKTREIATRLGAGYAENFRDYERLDRTRRHGSEIWQPLLLGLLLLLFGEVFLQQRISKA